MRSPFAPKNDDTPEPQNPARQEPEAPAADYFAWPPPDDVLQNMAVIDFVTGETRPLRLEPQHELAAGLEEEGAGHDAPADGDQPLMLPSSETPIPAASAAGAAPVGSRANRPAYSNWIWAGAAIIAIAAAALGAWNLQRRLARQPSFPPSAAQLEPAPPNLSSPPPASPAAQADTPGVSEAQPTSGASGSVVVRTDTDGARVWIDGVYVGRTPLNAASLLPGAHSVSVEGPAGRIPQTISVAAGSTSTVFVSTGAGVAGGISVTAPSEIEVREAGRVVGTSRADRILLEPGRHTLDLVNETLGYESRQVVDVLPGKFLAIPIQFGDGSLNINALPWAEVFVDGQRIGETPIGNLKVRVGTHQVTFRHPELGDTTRTVEVTLRGPARISVNLERKER